MLVALHVPPGVVSFSSKEEDLAPEPSVSGATHRGRSFRLQSDSRNSGRERGGSKSHLLCDVYCRSGEEVFVRVAQPLLHALSSLHRDKKGNVAKDGMLVFDGGVRQRRTYYPQKDLNGEKGFLQRAPGGEVFISSCRWLLEFSGATHISASAVRMKESNSAVRNVLVDLLADEPSGSFPDAPSSSRREDAAPSTTFKDGEEETSIFGSRVLPILSLVHAQKLFALCVSVDPVRTGSAGESDAEEGTVVITLCFSLSPHSVHKEPEVGEEKTEIGGRRTVLHEREPPLPRRTLHFMWLPSLHHAARGGLGHISSSSALPDELHLGLHRKCVHQAASCLASSSSSLLSSFPILHQCWRKSIVCALLKPFLLGQQPSAWVTSLSCIFYSPCAFSSTWTSSPIVQEIMSLSRHIYASRHHPVLCVEESRSHSTTASCEECEQTAPFLSPFLAAASHAQGYNRTPPFLHTKGSEWREVNDPTAEAPDNSKTAEEKERMTEQWRSSPTEATRRRSVADDDGKKQSPTFGASRSQLRETEVPFYSSCASTPNDKGKTCSSSSDTTTRGLDRHSPPSYVEAHEHSNLDTSYRSAAAISSSSTVLAQQRVAGMQELKHLSQCNRNRVQQRQEEEQSFWNAVNGAFHSCSTSSLPVSYALTGATPTQENKAAHVRRKENNTSTSLKRKGGERGAEERIPEALLVSKEEGNPSFSTKEVHNRHSHQTSLRYSVSGSRAACASPRTPRFSFSPFRLCSVANAKTSTRKCAISFSSSPSWTFEEEAALRDDRIDRRKAVVTGFPSSMRSCKIGKKEARMGGRKETESQSFQEHWGCSARWNASRSGGTNGGSTAVRPTTAPLLHRERLQRPYRLDWEFTSTIDLQARERETPPFPSSLAMQGGFFPTTSLFFSPADRDSTTFHLHRSSRPREWRERSTRATGKAVSEVFLQGDHPQDADIETSFSPSRRTVETSTDGPHAACPPAHPIDHSRQKRTDPWKDLHDSSLLSSKPFQSLREEEEEVNYFPPTYQDFLNIKPHFKLKHCAKPL